MNIAVLGGSFDPPHIGHYWIATQVLEARLDIDKVILIPVNKHQWKPISASTQDRLEMLQFYISGKIEVSDIEINRGNISYTEDTLKALKKSYNKIYWIVGSDILDEYSKWDKKDEILSLAKLLVFPRDPYLMPDSLPLGFEPLVHDGLITSNISSTKIKKRIQKGLPVTSFVLQGVDEYIKKHKLYLK